ncbi:serine/threonine-protein kinase nek3 [Biomphalaria pfeifferi]|uniref:Serine/threonine-protein kinase nek3 n=1 Tax=Biomphalaria pfeifferi TaxID=112525 RepID=A0AAD8BIT6_BIOPF|nr:serine/threonine-protein kinase nek3 [Biomphalaria pfeifferi]
MSLLVTSCTMGKQPNRLLHKGPAYLKTRTNMGLFAQNRKSAVELLAASKAQFYVKSSVKLEQHQDLAVSDGQNQRFSSKESKQKEPARSKSEFDLSQILLYKVEDENNNDTSNDSINVSEKDVQTNVQKLFLKDTAEKDASEEKTSTPASFNPENVKGKDSLSSGFSVKKTSLNGEETDVCHQTSLSISSATLESKLEDNTASDAFQDNVKLTKPVPLPRRLREKPVPPPRKYRVSAVILGSEPDPLEPPVYTVTKKDVLTPTDSPKSVTRVSSRSETKPAIPKKPIVLSNTARDEGLFTSRSISQISIKSSPEVEKTNTYTAKPIFISCPVVKSEHFQAKPVYISELGVTLTKRSQTVTSNRDFLDNKSKKQCPDSVSTKSVFCKRNSTDSSDSSSSKNRLTHTLKSEILNQPYSKLEMSIESAEQAVYESDISVVPLASMESELDQSEDGEVREVSRANSSLSGTLDQQDASPLSLSPTPYSSCVPRSHSDISCRLESQHSRDSSIVSSRSRLSRASAGADLEIFFNQMGLEKGVLEPINRLKELQTSEVFESMSSLDSHDAASICSTYSRSEQEWSESQSMDRSHHQTSIIERNARIIKWLCNVRKAKNPAKTEMAAGGKE